MGAEMAEVRLEIENESKTASRKNNVSAISAGVHTGSTKLDKDIQRRLAAADTNNDGTLAHEEIVELVKELVLEHRTTKRTRVVAAASFLMLLLSCFGNFALMVW